MWALLLLPLGLSLTPQPPGGSWGGGRGEGREGLWGGGHRRVWGDVRGTWKDMGGFGGA